MGVLLQSRAAALVSSELLSEPLARRLARAEREAILAACMHQSGSRRLRTSDAAGGHEAARRGTGARRGS